MAYVGSLPCGCIVTATIDNPEHRDDIAQTVAQMLRDGETVDRRAVEVVRLDPAFLRDCGGPAHDSAGKQ
jgi:hypothetical protein